jgi:hypothetical protein
MGLANQGKDRKKGRRPADRWGIPTTEERPLGITLGIIFGVIGGIIIAASAFLSWVQTTNALDQVAQIYLTDLPSHGSVFYAAFLVPIAGAIAAILSALELLGVRGFERVRRYSPSGALVFAIIAAVALILTAYFIDTDIRSGAASAIFGPAVVLSVFGVVLTVAGGLVMTIDQLEMRRNAGKFRVSGSDEKLMRALKPRKKTKRQARSRDTSLAESKDRELEDEIRASDEARTAKEEGQEEAEVSCPRCGAPIVDDPAKCPECGMRLR